MNAMEPWVPGKMVSKLTLTVTHFVSENAESASRRESPGKLREP
jgi:hypothetical protein